MNTGSRKISEAQRDPAANGFTLLDLLVLIAVLAVLIVLELPVLAAGGSQSKIVICASHVRQLALASQIYANDNNNRLPLLNGSGAWAWDTPVSTADALLNSGAQTNTFYCPGTSPRFTDIQNWAGPGTTLWNFGSTFHIIGYTLAFSGSASKLSPTNQNTSILPEAINNFPSAGMTTTYSAANRVLVADATISIASILPGYAHPENNYTSIYGGFVYPHLSAHLKGNVPAGGNLGFKDGHVEWRDFEFMTPRTGANTPYFWW
ncbi:MAG TPA: type II secretion system protein [Verrucomicrobiae bacterium]|nr:type II secretion system protein [Verrucomicrobiae bacterium]